MLCSGWAPGSWLGRGGRGPGAASVTLWTTREAGSAGHVSTSTVRWDGGSAFTQMPGPAPMAAPRPRVLLRLGPTELRRSPLAVPPYRGPTSSAPVHRGRAPSPLGALSPPSPLPTRPRARCRRDPCKLRPLLPSSASLCLHRVPYWPRRPPRGPIRPAEAAPLLPGQAVLRLPGPAQATGRAGGEPGPARRPLARP